MPPLSRVQTSGEFASEFAKTAGYSDYFCKRIASFWTNAQTARMTPLDAKDLAILAALQRDGSASALAMAETLGMSGSQIGRRRQRLEAEGYIEKTTCRLNAKLLGLDVQAFIQVQTDAQGAETHSAIRTLVRTQPEIVAAWTLTGEADYMFRVYCRDLGALNRLIQTVLLPHPSIGRVQSQIVMEELADETALPLASR